MQPEHLGFQALLISSPLFSLPGPFHTCARCCFLIAAGRGSLPHTQSRHLTLHRPETQDTPWINAQQDSALSSHPPLCPLLSAFKHTSHSAFAADKVHPSSLSCLSLISCFVLQSPRPAQGEGVSMHWPLPSTGCQT